MSKSQKITIGVSIDTELLEWIDSQVASKRFANRSHAVNACLYDCKCTSEKDKMDNS